MIFNAWTHWLSSLAPDQLFWMLAPLLLLDSPRYLLGAVAICIVDSVRDAWRWMAGAPSERQYEYCPSVCAILAGLNEADTLCQTLESLWGTYPRLEIIVVDDGSDDGMTDVAREFALTHSGVLVLRKPQRGGKSSALNFALPFTRAELIVCVDTDSHLGPNAIWEIVQPFRDETVGAVSGTVAPRNAFTNVVTWLQGLEYLRCIFIGRMVTSRLNILGIVSGAFGAFRRSAIERVRGWDVGPGEDGDVVLRLRKSGYRVVFAPYAQCFTSAPTAWDRLFRQRRRWEWAVVTFECRKHLDLADVFGANFRMSNFALLADRWLYNVVLVYVFWGYFTWLCFRMHDELHWFFLTNYAAYVVIEFLQLLVILSYSTDRRRDLKLGLATPLMPLYYLWLRAVSLIAVTEEMFTRRSFRDGFVPPHVRQATWHW